MDQRPQKPAIIPAPAEAAAYWKMRQQSGAMDATERAAFREWLSAAPENAIEFALLEKSLEAIDEYEHILLESEFERELHAESERISRHGARRFQLIAASLAILSITVVTAIFSRQTELPIAQTYETVKGQHQIIALEDGSRVELNSGAAISVAFGKSERAVTLKSGEAFFDVEKDKTRPFLVKTELAQIGVTGTSFGVSEIDGKLGVHVMTGVVDVAAANGPVATLLAGDAIEVGSDGRAGKIMRFDPNLALAWRSGKARFRDQPLEEVLRSLNRYFDTPIELSDPALATLPVTGEFDIRDRDTAVTALALIFNLESEEEPARIVLKPADDK